jgi:hypothetical protein
VGYRISNHVFSSEDIKHHVRRNHNEDWILPMEGFFG